MKDLWVFGYGSLMWRPGFDHVERTPALLYGAHRSLCVYSFNHRGTESRPGLVFGLDQGGSCRGVAFRVAAHRCAAVLQYLREREQVSMVYREVFRPLRLLNGARRVEGLCYLVDRTHRQYAGKLPLDAQAAHVLQGRGYSGDNIDYVDSTRRHLEEIGIYDSGLTAVTELVERRQDRLWRQDRTRQ